MNITNEGKALVKELKKVAKKYSDISTEEFSAIFLGMALGHIKLKGRSVGEKLALLIRLTNILTSRDTIEELGEIN